MKNKTMKFAKWIALAMVLVAMFSLSGCGKNSSATGTDLSEEWSGATMKVASQSIVPEGKLKTVCANDEQLYPAGDNVNPQLSFDEVEGASFYVVVMYDASAKNYLHWYSFPVVVNEIAQGTYTDKSIYIGPYPPKNSKAHTYRIRVFALANIPDEIPEVKTGESFDFTMFVDQLDCCDSKTGNILAIGETTALYEFGYDVR